MSTLPAFFENGLFFKPYVYEFSKNDSEHLKMTFGNKIENFWDGFYFEYIGKKFYKTLKLILNYKDNFQNDFFMRNVEMLKIDLS